MGSPYVRTPPPWYPSGNAQSNDNVDTRVPVLRRVAHSPIGNIRTIRHTLSTT